jgi:hypothetical protein
MHEIDVWLDRSIINCRFRDEPILVNLAGNDASKEHAFSHGPLLIVRQIA